MEKMYFNKNLGKSVFITTNGCSENRFDCAKMNEFFTTNGWSVVANVQKADIILFNACGLTKIREDDSLGVLKEINTQKKSSADIIVWGCFPKINKERIGSAHKGIIFDSDESERLEDIFEGKIKTQETQANYLMPSWQESFKISKIYRRLPHVTNIRPYIQLLFYWHLWAQASNKVSFTDSDSFSIKVSTGCLNFCSYCGVSSSRGRLRSKPVGKIVEEFREGLGKNFKKFTLIGTDLAAYGRDQGTNLVHLLETLVKFEGHFKLRLSNVNPRFLIEMVPDLRDVFRTEKIEVVGSGVQSGNNRILKLMNRGYTIEDYREAMSILKTEHPDIRIRTNVIVGFPSETEQDFQDTVRLLKEVDFTFVDIHRYSPRFRTTAENLPGQLPKKIIEDRYGKWLLAFTQHLRKRK